jgi:hypothetical protein
MTMPALDRWSPPPFGGSTETAFAIRAFLTLWSGGWSFRWKMRLDRAWMRRFTEGV